MLPLENYLERVRSLFGSAHMALVIDAVIAGNSPGRLWVDDANEPRSALLWDNTHNFYLAGAADNALFNLAVNDLFVDEITPFAQEHELGIFKLYYSSDHWERPIETLFGGYALR